jgi:hypothetical protein
MTDKSIFAEYYAKRDFVDRYEIDPERAVTIIIPTIHTNELWRANLLSIYREVPVAKLLLGDGGCIDDTVAIVKQFPRVEVHDHRAYKSLGYSIRKLIEAVETDWFIYLHSDVYLPPGWFDEMCRYQGKYDWFGCRMQQTVMVEFDNDYGARPYAGSQMGKKEAFEEGLKKIDDDFVYRQEDFVFSDIVVKAGYKEGKIDSIFHYHQLIKKPSPHWNPKFSQFSLSAQLSPKEEIRTWDSQAKGIIKYLEPNNEWAINDASYGVYRMIQLRHWTEREIISWIFKTNPRWAPIIKKKLFILKIRSFIQNLGLTIKKLGKRLEAALSS